MAPCFLQQCTNCFSLVIGWARMYPRIFQGRGGEGGPNFDGKSKEIFFYNFYTSSNRHSCFCKNFDVRWEPQVWNKRCVLPRTSLWVYHCWISNWNIVTNLKCALLIMTSIQLFCRETDELASIVEYLETKSVVNPKEIALAKREEMKKKGEIKSPGKKRGRKSKFCWKVFFFFIAIANLW